jgi:hypothetical protein
MNKKILLAIVIVIVAAVIGFVIFNKTKTETPKTENQKPASNLTPLTAKYWIETDLISLEKGKAETINPNGAAKLITEVVGQPVSGDLNSDGQADYALVLKQQTENDPGVYYYAAIALVDEAKNIIVGSNAVALGEGIKIEDIAIVNQAVRINYLERKINGDAVAKEPTEPISKSFILDGVMFKELTEKRANAQAEAACTDNRGAWIITTTECKGLSNDWCNKTGGKFENNLCKF